MNLIARFFLVVAVVLLVSAVRDAILGQWMASTIELFALLATGAAVVLLTDPPEGPPGPPNRPPSRRFSPRTQPGNRPARDTWIEIWRRQTKSEGRG